MESNSFNLRLVYLDEDNQYKYFYINLYDFLKSPIAANPKWKLVSIDEMVAICKNNIFVNDIIEFEAYREAYYTKSIYDGQVIARGLVKRHFYPFNGFNIRHEDVEYNKEICKRKGKEKEERCIIERYCAFNNDKTASIGTIYENKNLLGEVK